MVCFPPDVQEINEEGWKSIIGEWMPTKSFTNCRDLHHNSNNFLKIYSKESSTYIIQSDTSLTVDIRFIDDSFTLNQELNGKKYLVIPAYRPIQWIHFVGSPTKVCAFSDADSDTDKMTGSCDSACKFNDLTEKNSVIAKFPRQLDKPTHEFFLTAEKTPERDDVTLCTILTYDRLLRLRQMAEMYQGPISAAVYLVNTTMEMPLLLKEWLSSPAMRKYVDVHLVIDDNINSINWPDRPFPVNILRNVGLTYARTEYLSFIEADFIPNRSFKEDVKLIKDHMKLHPKSVYIIPSFYTWNKEIAQADFDLNKFPKTKAEIRDNNKFELKPMNEVFTSHSQIPYQKWFGGNEIIHVGKLSSQEPYYIAHRSMPKFEPIFIGCGQDKVQHTSELVSRGWDFYMIPQGFIAHLDSTGMGSAWCRNFASRWGDMKWQVMNERVSHSLSVDEDTLTEWWDLVPKTLKPAKCPVVRQSEQPAPLGPGSNGVDPQLIQLQDELDKTVAENAAQKQKEKELLLELDRNRLALASLQGVLKEKDDHIIRLNSSIDLVTQSIFIIVSLVLIGGVYLIVSRRTRKESNHQRLYPR